MFKAHLVGGETDPTNGRPDPTDWRPPYPGNYIFSV